MEILKQLGGDPAKKCEARSLSPIPQKSKTALSFFICFPKKPFNSQTNHYKVEQTSCKVKQFYCLLISNTIHL